MDTMKLIKNLLHEGNLIDLKYFCLNNNIVAEDYIKNYSFDILTFAIENDINIEIIDFICQLYKNINYELSDGIIPLFLAISKQKYGIADVLIKNHANINFCNKNGDNILLFLFNNDELKKYQLNYIIEKGIDIYYRDASDNNIIYYAIENKFDFLLNTIIYKYIYNNEFILSLISLGKRGVKISKKLISHKVGCQIEKFNLYTLEIFKKAVNYRCIDIIEFFAKYCNRAFEYYIPLDGNDLLLNAISVNSECVVDYILKNGLCNMNEQRSKNRMVENAFNEPLISAIIQDKPVIVKQLVKAKFDVNLNIQDKFNPLTFACFVDNLEIAKILVKAGAKINKYYYFVELPFAAKQGNFEMVKFLLEVYRKQYGRNKKLSVSSLKLKLKHHYHAHQVKEQRQQHQNHIYQQLDNDFDSDSDNDNDNDNDYNINNIHNINNYNENSNNKTNRNKNNNLKSLQQQQQQQQQQSQSQYQYQNQNQNQNQSQNQNHLNIPLQLQTQSQSHIQFQIQSQLQSQCQSQSKYQSQQQKQIQIYGNCLYAAMYAFTNKHYEIYNYLMNYSNYFSKNNLIYKVPMVIALSENNYDTVKFLHKKGIPLNQTFNFSVSLFEAIVKNLSKHCNDILYNENPLIHLEDTSLLHYSVMKGQYDIVKYLLENDVNVNFQCSKGYTALMIATKNFDIRMVNLLVAYGAKVNLKDNEGVSALTIACLNGYLILIKYLIDSGGDINIQTKYGENMLILAYQLAIGNNQYITNRYSKAYFNSSGIKPPRKCYENIVNYLIARKIDVKVKDINNISTIDYAVINNRVADAKFFIKRGTKPNTQFLEHDVLKYIIIKGWYNMFCLLINIIDFDLEKTDSNDNTPLICAVLAENFEMVKELVNAGVNIHHKNKKGYNALIYAVRKKYTRIAKYLIDQGININEKDNEGYTALMHAIESPNYSNDIVKYLVEHGASVNVKSHHQLTPLILATKNNNNEITEYLVRNGANINDQDQTGTNSLMYTILNYNYTLSKFLIENKISINEKNKMDYTALMLASENGYYNLVKLLVENGADISIKTKKRYTAIKLASKRKHHNVVKYLSSQV